MVRPVVDPWPYPVRWREAAGAGVTLDLVADEAARNKITRMLGEIAVASLSAHARLATWMDGAELSGRLKAVVTRECGVTLDPYDEIVDEAFRLRFVPAGSPYAPQVPEGEDQVIDLEGDDPPDVVAGETIDVGAALVEQLALALEPFPRKPDAVFEAPADTGESSPFAALAALKSKAPE